MCLIGLPHTQPPQDGGYVTVIAPPSSLRLIGLGKALGGRAGRQAR